MAAAGHARRRDCGCPAAELRVCFLQRVRDRVEGVEDLVAQQREHRDDDRGDEGEDDSVLGHGLAFLALDVLLHPLDCELDHLNELPVVVVAKIEWCYVKAVTTCW